MVLLPAGLADLEVHAGHFNIVALGRVCQDGSAHLSGPYGSGVDPSPRKHFSAPPSSFDGGALVCPSGEADSVGVGVEEESPSAWREGLLPWRNQAQASGASASSGRGAGLGYEGLASLVRYLAGASGI